jgi:hypothetical protein
MGRFAVLAIAVSALGAEAAFARVGAVSEVDLALVIAVDVSTSMDVDEQKLQREGYVAAFRHPDVIEAIAGGARGRTAVTYIEWAGTGVHAVIVPWTDIADRGDADAFAARLAAAPLRHEAGTSISGGLLFAAGQFNRRSYRGDRLAVDISGDGPNNMGPPVTLMRDWLVRRGVTINGLPIMLNPDIEGGVSDLDRYYKDCVIGGPGAFTLPVRDAGSFAAAIRSKLILEIAALPAPPPRPMLAAAVSPVPGIDCMIGERTRAR